MAAKSVLPFIQIAVLMKNAVKYHFSDFTRRNYRRLLKLAKSTYVDRGFRTFCESERFILWRHDVDFSPQSARKISIIESEEGIRTTYFLLLHSTFYNLLEKDVTDCIRDIIARGHFIGLHFDPQYYDLTCDEELRRKLTVERKILENLFNVDVRVFSFHISTRLPWPASIVYAGLVNATADFSAGASGIARLQWILRFKRLENVLQDAEEYCLQVLTHPEMAGQGHVPKERVRRCIQGRADSTRRWYEAILREHGRQDVDWE